MSVRKSNSGYSLELVVGVQDLFSAGKKKIEKESRELDREFKDLQKTVKDVSAYQKAEGALNQLSKAENDHIRKLKEQKKALEALTRAEKKDEKAIEALKDDIEAMAIAGKKNTQATRAQEREFNRLSKSLKNTGVDLSDVINEERRLKTEVDKTTTALKKQSTTMNSMDRTMKTMENVGMIAGGVAATAGLMWAGNNKQQNERLLASGTGYSLEQVQSQAQREFRADLNRKYGASDVDIFESQAIAKQQNLSDAETLDLAESAIEYKSIFPETDLNMFNQAVANVSKSFGISIKDAANKIYAVTSEVGDRDGDILTNYKEYAPLLGDDVSIDQLNATIVAAKKAGVYNADVIFDSLKESFQARFSDQDEFSKLVGDGTKSGSIDNINDLALRKEVKDAAYRVRDDLSSGIPAGQSYANLLQSVQKVDVAQPGITKKLLEDIGGVRMSEDIGTKGVAAMAGALATPNNYLVEKSLTDAALDTRTALGTLTSSFTSLQGVINTAAGDLMENLGGLADAVSSVSQSASSELQSNSTLSTAAVAAQSGILGLAGGAILKKILFRRLDVGKLFTNIGGTNASGASGLFGYLLKGGSKATSDAASDIASNAASKGASSASSLIGKGASALKGAGKLIPFVGTGLQSLSLASNINSGDTKNAWGDVGSMIGSWGGGIAGGVAGSFVMPGAGTVAGAGAGSVSGALAGEEIAEWLYSVFNGDEVGQAEIAQVEDDVVNASQSSSLAIQPSAIPAIEFNFMPQISIETGTSDAAVISDSLVQALRNMSPELQQQFKDTLNDLFNSGEYVES